MRLASFIFITVFFTSCLSQKKLTEQIKYFKPIKDTIISIAKPYEPIFKSGDILEITIGGDQKDAAQYQFLSQFSSGGKTTEGASSGSTGYLVGSDGYIHIPVLGSFKAAGLNKNELRNLLLPKIIQHDITNPVVQIRISNYKINILGDVGKPGLIRVPGERITILDAIGEAGDLAISGNRDNILVMRQTDSSKIETIRMSLNDPKIFSSPYFYLQQNDLVYVEPTKVKAMSINTDPPALRYLTTGVAIVTAIALLINIFK